MAPHTDILEQTRSAIRFELTQGILQAHRVATLLQVSERTLRRRLQEQGTSYQDLVDEIRCELALELLQKERGLTNDRISQKLGYSSPTSFNRAFRRWTGRAPRSARGINYPVLSSTADA